MSRKYVKKWKVYIVLSVFLTGIMAVMLILNLVVFRMIKSSMTEWHMEVDTIEGVESDEQPDFTDSGENASSEMGGEDIVLPENTSPELLVLVNHENPIEEGYDPKLRKICKGRLEASEYLYQDLCAMLEAAGKDGYDYWIASAYRSVEYQQELIEKDIQNYVGQGYSRDAARAKSYEYKMPPGNSEHHTGLALDILCSTNLTMDATQGEEPGNAWLREHCSDYGFVLRYPEGREAVTGIKYEPWHFRYVGREAAKFMTEHQLVLEEYVAMLEDSDFQN